MNKYKRIIVTEKEEDLIMSIRNYQRSYPNGNPQMDWYIRQLFDELMDMPPQYIPTIPSKKKLKPWYMETILKENRIELATDVKAKLSDILMLVTWRDIARTYFGKSSSWIYHKLDGIDGNGGKGGFTPEEQEQLRNALFDLSERIRIAANKL